MQDERLSRIVRTGRLEAAVAPDPRRERHLVGSMAQADGALVGVHADGKGAAWPRQAASAGLVRPSALAVMAFRQASAAASNASMAEV